MASQAVTKFMALRRHKARPAPRAASSASGQDSHCQKRSYR